MKTFLIEGNYDTGKGEMFILEQQTNKPTKVLGHYEIHLED